MAEDIVMFLVDEGSVVKVAEDLYTRKHFMEEAREIVEGMLRGARSSRSQSFEMH